MLKLGARSNPLRSSDHGRRTPRFRRSSSVASGRIWLALPASSVPPYTERQADLARRDAPRGARTHTPGAAPPKESWAVTGPRPNPVTAQAHPLRTPVTATGRLEAPPIIETRGPGVETRTRGYLGAGKPAVAPYLPSPHPDRPRKHACLRLGSSRHLGQALIDGKVSESAVESWSRLSWWRLCRGRLGR